VSEHAGTSQEVGNKALALVRQLGNVGGERDAPLLTDSHASLQNRQNRPAPTDKIAPCDRSRLVFTTAQLRNAILNEPWQVRAIRGSSDVMSEGLVSQLSRPPYALGFGYPEDALWVSKRGSCFCRQLSGRVFVS
jgi:hypothetical protein